MQRRNLLTNFGVMMFLSGCAGQDNSGSVPTEESPTDRTEQRNTGTTDAPGENTIESKISRIVTLNGQSNKDLRETFEIGADVTVLESSVTEAQTARIGITLENRTTKPQTLSYIRDTCDLNLITGQYRHDTDISLLLISTEQEWDRTETDCWVPDGRNLNCGIPTTEHEITIMPDEPIQWMFRLWTEPKDYYNDMCMPQGMYRFIRTLKQEETEASLSFTLSVDSK